jgi:hypothetical protein
MEAKTIVVFRRWRNGGDIIALFPGIESSGYDCESYQHVGQHGGADFTGVIQVTNPARSEEYADLKRELEQIGYNLEVRKRGASSLFYRNR